MGRSVRKFFVPLLVLVLLTAACGGDDEDAMTPAPEAPAAPEAAAPAPADEPAAAPEPAAPAPAEEPAAAPEPPPPEPAAEKTLIVAAVDTAPTLDTEFFAGTPQSWEMTDNIYDTKFWYGDDGVERDFNQFLPRQFASAEVSADGTEWTFVMRDDLVDENGDQATTEDFMYTIDRAFGVQAVNQFLLLLMNVTSADQFEAVDDYTVKMTLADFSPLVQPIFTLSFIPIMNKDIVEANATADDPWALNWLATNAAGFGPYYIEENTAGQQTVLRANPNYWAGKPDIDRIIYRAVPESSNRVSALLSGAVDMALALSGTELSSIASNDNVELSVFEGNNITTIIPNNAVPPFDNPLVRQALAYAAPYDEIIAIFDGWASSISSYIPPMFPGYTDEYFPYETDVEKARALIATSGVETPINATLTYADHRPEHERVAVAVKSAWEEIGVNIDLNKVTFGTFADISNSRDFELIMTAALQSHAIDTLYGMEIFSGAGLFGFLNYGNYGNADVHALFDAGRFETDNAARLDIARQIQQIMADDPPWIVLALPQYVVSHRPGVEGILWPPDEGLRFWEMRLTE